MSRRITVLCVLILFGHADAELRLASVFGDHMVLQRGKSINIWGTADSGTSIQVRIANISASISTDTTGRWQTLLPPLPPGGPHTLHVSSDIESVQLADVLIGDVWLAAGQSNMSWPLHRVTNAAEELSEAHWPNLRLMTMPTVASDVPQEGTDRLEASGGGRWVVCQPDSVAEFSAVAYFFGRRLQSEIGVPIGLVEIAWPSSPIETWIDEESLLANALLFQGLQESLSHSKAVFARHARSRLQWETALADPGVAAAFTSRTVDIRDWSPQRIPGTWKFHGMVWFRREVNIPASWRGQDLLLDLGASHGLDMAYFDDRALDLETAGWRVPGHWVDAAIATITVRASDRDYAGGLFGSDPQALPHISPAKAPENGQSLAGLWHQRAGQRRPTSIPLPQKLPASAYNGMVHPLQPMRLRGVIWYQGEANISDGALYADKMETLIRNWRRVFVTPDLPFYFVQLAPHRYRMGESLPLLWEAQSTVPTRVTHTHMVVIHDVSDPDDMHPRNKRPVGERLARLALEDTYGLNSPNVHGPIFSALRVEGTHAILEFAHAEGLTTCDGEAPSLFEVAGADGEFVPAETTIQGHSIIVQHPSGIQPTSVRFAWSETAMPNLVNGAGLPAAPFRTQDSRRPIGD
ncbi:MAG: hypothetical protein HOM68_04225 [Gemmatimonadetes bacterium]|jgi:sialate O-acetylesterase|nr:hypothetical protein [Gemmatimonadota bacterium]MBT5587531.1 hypothetical protein [Gemmatimonadota bacterium]MBT6626111.1 hypothetical protein [Gemmatimonadota bacterium]MBT7456461.1 hypothetical protein [Gemmatimonadota bacterium]